MPSPAGRLVDGHGHAEMPDGGVGAARAERGDAEEQVHRAGRGDGPGAADGVQLGVREEQAVAGLRRRGVAEIGGELCADHLQVHGHERRDPRRCRRGQALEPVADPAGARRATSPAPGRARTAARCGRWDAPAARRRRRASAPRAADRCRCRPRSPTKNGLPRVRRATVATTSAEGSAPRRSVSAAATSASPRPASSRHTARGSRASPATTSRRSGSAVISPAREVTATRMRASCASRVRGEQRERSRVGPLGVVDHEHQPGRTGDAGEEPRTGTSTTPARPSRAASSRSLSSSSSAARPTNRGSTGTNLARVQYRSSVLSTMARRR
jgi:hypothetical protein